jgi:hypothetical protein
MLLAVALDVLVLQEFDQGLCHGQATRFHSVSLLSSLRG